eukprot:scaffold1949_cov119-Cylindrotheca_fusiformis.AAC.7
MTLTVVAAYKNDSSKLGIILCRKSKRSPLTIQKILAGGIFHDKGLVPGMVVAEVNGEYFKWKSPVDAALLLKNAPCGSEVSLTVETFSATVHRESLEQRWGLHLTRPEESSGLVIRHIFGLFENTNLKEGMKIIEINGEPCPRRVSDAFDMLTSTKYDMKIVAVVLDCLDLGIDSPGDFQPTDTNVPRLDNSESNVLNTLPTRDGQGLSMNSDPSLKSMRRIPSLVIPPSPMSKFPTMNQVQTKKIPPLFRVLNEEKRPNAATETSSEGGQDVVVHERNSYPSLRKRLRYWKRFKMLKKREISAAISKSLSAEESGSACRSTVLNNQREDVVVPETRTMAFSKKKRWLRWQTLIKIVKRRELGDTSSETSSMEERIYPNRTLTMVEHFVPKPNSLKHRHRNNR